MEMEQAAKLKITGATVSVVLACKGIHMLDVSRLDASTMRTVLMWRDVTTAVAGV